MSETIILVRNVMSNMRVQIDDQTLYPGLPGKKKLVQTEDNTNTHLRSKIPIISGLKYWFSLDGICFVILELFSRGAALQSVSSSSAKTGSRWFISALKNKRRFCHSIIIFISSKLIYNEQKFFKIHISCSHLWKVVKYLL